ncbi:hypothetical protein ACHHYP_12930 [Achlya hypogyna]|uniref:Uncharacterized protein n=1 Tax=Achlya hypogyna TaxID=1202772 RepID=A0A1V9ZGQ7_ACHHY|nr:hypothetical protein ACHHYP_12930 [Achlya hypogyna]
MADYPQKPASGAPQPAMGVPVTVDQYGRPVQPVPMAVDQYGRPVPMGVDQYGRPVPMAMAPPPVVGVIDNNSNIRRDAQGNALCRKCSTPYPLPSGCTSWRCRQCGELNNASVYGDECPCCNVM